MSEGWWKRLGQPFAASCPGIGQVSGDDVGHRMSGKRRNFVLQRQRALLHPRQFELMETVRQTRHRITKARAEIGDEH